MKIQYKKSFWGNELRIWVNKKIVYLINRNGSFGCETPSFDLWDDGWRIGFTKITKFIKWTGFYLIKATQ